MLAQNPYALVVFKTPDDTIFSSSGKSLVDRYIYSADNCEFIRTHLTPDGEYDPVEVNFCSFMSDFTEAAVIAKHSNLPALYLTVTIPIHGTGFDILLEDIPPNIRFAFAMVDEKLKSIEMLNRQIITSLTATQDRIINSSAPVNDRVESLYESRGYLYSTLMGMYRTCTSWLTDSAMSHMPQRCEKNQETSDVSQPA